MPSPSPFPRCLRRTWTFLLPCLVCWFFILAYFSANLTYYGTQWSTVLVPMGRACLWCLPAFALGAWVFRSAAKGALVCLGLVLLAFVPASALPILPNIRLSLFGMQWGRLLLITPLCLLAFAFASYRIARMDRTAAERRVTVLLKIAVCFFVSSAAITARNLAAESVDAAQEEWAPLPAGFVATPNSYPNILYLVADAYGRQDVLAHGYDHDNEPFLRELEARGFEVIRDAISNYSQTKYSQASTLNLRYMSDLLRSETTSSTTLHNLIKRSFVFRRLLDLGYTVGSYPTGYLPTEDIERAVTLSGDPQTRSGRAHQPSDTLRRDLADRCLTLIPYKLRVAVQGGREDDPVVLHRQRVENCLTGMGQDGLTLQEPFFLYGHVLAPHPPFLVDAHGNAQKLPFPYSLADGSHWKAKVGGPDPRHAYRMGYAAQLQWINGRILDLIDRAQANYNRRPLIIILQGDHGPGSEYDQMHHDRTNLRERLGILLAVRVDEPDREPLRRIRSPVNLFRVLFNLTFGEAHPLLLDRSFHVTASVPPQFHEVPDDELTRLPAPPGPSATDSTDR